MTCNSQQKIIFLYEDGTYKISRCCFCEATPILEKNLFTKNLSNIGVVALQNTKIFQKNLCDLKCSFKEKITSISFNILSACNIRCHHCCAGLDTKDDSFFLKENILERKNKLFNLLNFSKNWTLDKIELDGSGEIFLFYNDLIDYLKSITSKNVKNIEFYTNGQLLSKERIEELYLISQQTGVNYNFLISLDGCSKETYELSRPGASFEKILNNLKLLKQLFSNNVIAIFVLRKTNLKDLNQINLFFNNLGVTLHMVPDMLDENICKVFNKLVKTSNINFI